MKKLNFISQFIASALVCLTTLLPVSGSRVVFAAPIAPSAPVAPASRLAPVAPAAPTPIPEPLAPTPGPRISSTSTLILTPTPTPTPTPGPVQIAAQNEASSTDNIIANSGNGAGSINTSEENINFTSDVNQINEANVDNNLAGIVSTGDNTSSNNVGDTVVRTGDTTLQGSINTDVNYNSLIISQTDSQPALEVVNNDNGATSDNSASLTVDDSTSSVQSNIATIENNVNLQSISGNNTSSGNVGNTEITTGEANLGITVLTSANTNLSGVSVAEFNIDDNHVGDIVLAFPPNNNLEPQKTLSNTGNGSDSNNSASFDSSASSTVVQNNFSDVENNLTFVVNSGDNETNNNTGGNSEIKTGDSNIAANVVSFLNNNFISSTPQSLFGVVNIFGNLVGDIILPDIAPQINIKNSDNGANSNNDSSVNINNSQLITQSNTANINNDINIEVTTGANSADDNTYQLGQDGKINSGKASADVNVVNIANQNLINDAWWVVLVNRSGQWIGKILGNEKNNYAASPGTEFVLDESGNVVAVNNNNNGQNSSNNSSFSSNNNSDVNQTNTANLTNNIAIVANTGGNSASRNTSGESSVKTGDANVVLNVFNFVNNNFVGGKFVFALVNVFGNWVGNVVPPGYESKQSIISPKIDEPVIVTSSNDTSAISDYNPRANNTSTIGSGESNDLSNNSTENRINTSSSQNSNSSQNPTTSIPKMPIYTKKLAKNNQPDPAYRHMIIEDNTIQIPSLHSQPSMVLSYHLDNRWLYVTLISITLVFIIRQPKFIKRLGIFMGIL